MAVRTQSRTTTAAILGALQRLAIALLFAAIVVVSLAWLSGAFERKTPSHAAAPALRPYSGATAVVRRLLVPALESSVGTIRAVQETAISPEVLGRITQIDVRAGQAVRQGDVLVRLDDEDFRARLRQAEAALEAARSMRDQASAEFERVAALYQSSNASEIEYQRAETTFRAAEAEVRRADQARLSAEKNLSYTVIRAPFDAVVIDRRAEVGDTVSPERVLLTLYDPKRMQLVAAVRESLIQRLAVGQTLDITIDALNKTCSGQVTEIVPESDVTSRTFLVKVSGPCPPEIHSGMFGRLLIPLDDEEWLVVPRRAVQRVGQLDLVGVVAEDGGVRRRAVRLGRDRGEDVEVLAGLREGERVALSAAGADGGP